MALQQRTERLLGDVEEAASEAEAAEALHALLAATRSVPITFAHRTRAEALMGRLVQGGLLGVEHPLMRLLALRVSTHYLPGVSEFPQQQPPPPSSSDGVDAPKDEEEEEEEEDEEEDEEEEGEEEEEAAAAAAAAALAPMLRSPSGGGGGSRGGNDAWGFVFQPLPRGAQLLCSVTRAAHSRLRPPVYRLYVERLCLAGGGDEGAERQLRQALQAVGLDPRWVVGPGGTEDDAAGGQREDASRCLLEARRLKASPVGGKTSQQLVVYGFAPASSGATGDSSAEGGGSNGKKGKNGKRRAHRLGRSKGKEEGEKRVAVALGRLQSPAAGVLTATATAEAVEEDDPGPVAASSLGARLCVQVSERERLLSLSAVLPAAAGHGNVYTSARGVPEVLEAPLAHLQAALSQAKGAAAPQQPQQAFFGARSRPPRYSPLDRLYTLDFERGAARVREPSRKNLALMDVSHLPASALVAPPPAVGRGGSAGGGGGGGAGVVGRGWSRAGRGAAGQEMGWAHEGKGPKPVLQLGKMGDLRFSLDFRAPFSPFQALAVAIAAFEA